MDGKYRLWLALLTESIIDSHQNKTALGFIVNCVIKPVHVCRRINGHFQDFSFLFYEALPCLLKLWCEDIIPVYRPFKGSSGWSRFVRARPIRDEIRSPTSITNQWLGTFRCRRTFRQPRLPTLRSAKGTRRQSLFVCFCPEPMPHLEARTSNNTSHCTRTSLLG